MRRSAFVWTLPLALFLAGCATSRYRVSMSGLNSSPGAASERKFRLYPCDANKDGTYSPLCDSDNQLVRQAASKYPSVFSDDGDVVRMRWLVVNKFRNSQGEKTYVKDNGFSGLSAVWNCLAALSVCTLPMFLEDEYAYRIVLEFESPAIQALGVRSRQYDFAGYDQRVLSLVPPLAWFFPYGKPSDTPFYRKGFEVVPIDDARNHEVLWKAVVARAAIELGKAREEIEFRARDAERRRKQRSSAHPPVAPAKVPVAPAKSPPASIPTPQPAPSGAPTQSPTPASQPALSAEDIPM